MSRNCSLSKHLHGQGFGYFLPTLYDWEGGSCHTENLKPFLCGAYPPINAMYSVQTRRSCKQRPKTRICKGHAASGDKSGLVSIRTYCRPSFKQPLLQNGGTFSCNDARKGWQGGDSVGTVCHKVCATISEIGNGKKTGHTRFFGVKKAQKEHCQRCSLL